MRVYTIYSWYRLRLHECQEQQKQQLQQQITCEIKHFKRKTIRCVIQREKPYFTIALALVFLFVLLLLRKNDFQLITAKLCVLPKNRCRLIYLIWISSHSNWAKRSLSNMICFFFSFSHCPYIKKKHKKIPN